MTRFCVLAAAAVLALGSFACGARSARLSPPSARQNTIDGIKRAERDLGFSETGNFQTATRGRDAYYRCYYTGKLELPESYEKLRIKDGTPAGCPVDEEKYDLFFYKIEAVAGEDVAVTAALEQASDERLAVVVAHEDFHDDPRIQNLPTRIGEAATTLIGYLTAAHFALEEHGADTEIYRNLAREAELYARKSRLVNEYHRTLAALYWNARARKITRQEALARKTALFDRMQAACEQIEPMPVSFNKCLAANNNAGLAFEITYTRYYPLLYELHHALGEDIRRTIGVLRAAGELGTASEQRTEQFLRNAIEDCSKTETGEG